MYTVSIDSVNIAVGSGDVDMFELAPLAEHPIELVAIYLANKTEVGDTEEEMVAWTVTVLDSWAAGSGGVSVTPRPLDGNDATATFACEAGNTTVATGTTTVLHAGTWNTRSGLQIIFPAEARPRAAGAQAMIVQLPTAVTDDVQVHGTLYVREL